MYGCMKEMVWYCEVALPVAESFSLKAEKGTLAVPLLGCGWLLAAPKPLPVEPNPPVLVLVLVLLAPNPPVLPPNRPPPVVPVDAPKPVLAPPKRLLPVLLLAPKAGVLVDELLLAPKPPKPVPVPVPEEPPLPKRPPPVVELPNGFEPKAVLPVFEPKPPKR